MSGSSFRIIFMGATAALSFGASIGYGWGFALGVGLSQVIPEPPVPKPMEGARINDLRVQGSAYGASIPITYGTVRISGQVIWSSDLIETRHEEDSGGKGGDSGSEEITYTYAVNAAISVCESKGLHRVTKVWADGRLIYDGTTSVRVPPWLRIYTGAEDQLPDSLMEAYLGVGNVPAYRGQAMVVLNNFQLVDYGNRVPNFTFEVSSTVASTVEVEYMDVGQDIYSMAYADVTDELVIEGFNSYETVGQVNYYTYTFGDPTPNQTIATPVDSYSTHMRYSPVTQEVKVEDGARKQITLNLFTGAMGLELYDDRLYADSVDPYTGEWWGGDDLDYRDVMNYTSDLKMTAIYRLPDSPNAGAYHFFGNITFSPTHVYVCSYYGGVIFALDKANREAGFYVIHTNPHYNNPDPYPDYFYIPVGIQYDEVRNCLWCYMVYERPYSPNPRHTPPRYNQFDLGTNTFVKTLVAPDMELALSSYYLLEYDLRGSTSFYNAYNDTLWTCDTEGNVSVMNAETGDTLFAGYVGFTDYYTTPFYQHDKTCTYMLSDSTSVVRICVLNAPTDTVLVRDIVVDISNRCGLESELVEASVLTDICKGYTLPNLTTGRGAITPLVQVYAFDGLESDFVVRFVKRDGSSTIIIQDDELVIPNG